MRVFVTGGTGLIGSHLVADLRSHGHDVVALHRRGSDTRFLEECAVALVEGDVRDDAETLAHAMDGCSHVVHAAALVYADGSWPKVRAVNVDGTRNVLTAATLAEVGHAVHVSSVAVYGAVDGDVDEVAPVDSDLPPGDLYARSKREAESVARGVEEKRGLAVTILRPSAVYGERDRLMVPALLRVLHLPLVPLFGRAENALTVVYAGNVAAAIRLMLDAGQGRKTYDVGLDFPLTQRDLFAMLAAGADVVPRFISIPASLVRACAGILARVGVGTPGARHLPLERVARLALGENPYRSRRIRTELGWDPSYQHRDALARSARWAHQNH